MGFQKGFRIIAACLIAAPAFAQTDAQIAFCIREQAERYAPLCEEADTVAKSIANTCFPPPRGERPDPDVNKAGYWHHRLDQTQHDMVRDSALSRVLDLRADNPPDC